MKTSKNVRLILEDEEKPPPKEVTVKLRRTGQHLYGLPLGDLVLVLEEDISRQVAVATLTPGGLWPRELNNGELKLLEEWGVATDTVRRTIAYHL